MSDKRFVKTGLIMSVDELAKHLLKHGEALADNDKIITNDGYWSPHDGGMWRFWRDTESEGSMLK